MSLFPAYAPDGDNDRADEKREQDILMRNAGVGVMLVETTDEALDEDALLASDASEEPAPPPAAPDPPLDHFYLDGKADHANIGVTTLYYPGRPIYKRGSNRTLGCGEAGSGGRSARRRRYFLQPAVPEEREAGAREVLARAAAFRRMLAASPKDEDLWLRFIHFQEECGEAGAWLESCEEGARVQAGRRLCEERHRARRAVLTHRELRASITRDLRDEKCPSVRLEHWLRLMWTLGDGEGEGAGGAVGEVQRATLVALQDLSHEPRAYPHLLYVNGAVLRAAGLWEQLVLLIELVCAMNFPPCAAFPPPAPTPQRRLESERRLVAAEDEVIASGLPLSAVWVRAERLRGAAHWRPADPREPADADPQRAPAPADVAPLVRALRPHATLLACAALLRLAQVPLLPVSESAAAAWRGAGASAEHADPAAVTLAALARARRRLPADRAARDALARSLPALLDPPHYFSDDAGYLSWVCALWEACCEWGAAAGAAPGLALACWRLRWLHALARLAPPAEARRLRAQARHALRAHAHDQPAPFALFARLEADLGDRAGARRIALQAVRAAVGSDAVPAEQALFAARVLRELVGPEEPGLAAVALCCAVTRRPLPADLAAPSARLAREALERCESRCAELERRFSSGEDRSAGASETALCEALSCGAGEWAAARVALLPAETRASELARLQPGAAPAESPAALQYAEARACALALGARLSVAARALHPLFPNNALLALASNECGAWRGAGGGAARTHVAAHARVLGLLLRAPLGGADEAEARGALRRVARAAARAGARGAGGAALAVLRLEAEARASCASHRLLLTALHAHPNHKWVYVRGAQWVSAEAETLCDAALERGLRVHALTHELRPAPAAPAAPAPVGTEDSVDATVSST